jgi:hypothetical protein
MKLQIKTIKNPLFGKCWILEQDGQEVLICSEREKFRERVIHYITKNLPTWNWN